MKTFYLKWTAWAWEHGGVVKSAIGYFHIKVPKGDGVGVAEQIQAWLLGLA